MDVAHIVESGFETLFLATLSQAPLYVPCEPSGAAMATRAMKVLILGGGQAGLTVAVELSKRHTEKDPLSITLVDPKDYFEIRWASVRAMVNERVREDFTLLYSDVLAPRGIKHFQSKVKVLNLLSATLESGETLEFDICLIAVGAGHPMAGVDPEATELSRRKKELVDAGARYLSGDLVIVGGGLLGAEVAGEFSNSDHRITIVQNTDELVPEMRSNARRRTKQVLRRQGVQVITGHKAQEIADGIYQVGDSILDCDVGIRCTGYYSRSKFTYLGDLPQECRDKNGWIQTNQYFQVEGCAGRIYAFGDCCTTGPKLAQTVFSNYKAVVHNMLKSLDWHTNPIHFKSYSAPLPLCILTLGPNAGVADLPFGVFERVIPAYKNRTLFISYAKDFVEMKEETKWPKAAVTLAAVGAVAAVRIATSD